MDYAQRGSGLGEEDNSNSRKGKGQKQHHRHSAEQYQQLEAFFKENAHPDENQRNILGMDLGLDPNQIRFWFQNKRAQTKMQSGKTSNHTLRSENGTLRLENLTMNEMLKTVYCSSCNGPSPGGGDRQDILRELKLQNAFLKEEFERKLGHLTNFTGISTMPAPGIAHPVDSNTTENPSLPNQFNATQEMDNSLVIGTAVAAMDEIIELLCMKNTMWVNSPVDGRYQLNHDCYDMHFPKPCHFKTTSAQIESSIEAGEVAIAAEHLTEMLLDSDKWKYLFPTIITEAKTIEILDTGSISGALHLMYGKMHVLSPLVPPREFLFTRHCRQLSASCWVVVDVSCDYMKELQDASPIHSWKLPSGCMIEGRPNGNSYVTWIEHVEVDDNSMTHPLFKDLVSNCQAYGAKRWIAALQRTCDRFAFSMGLINSPNNALERANF